MLTSTGISKNVENRFLTDCEMCGKEKLSRKNEYESKEQKKGLECKILINYSELTTCWSTSKRDWNVKC